MKSRRSPIGPILCAFALLLFWGPAFAQTADVEETELEAQSKRPPPPFPKIKRLPAYGQVLGLVEVGRCERAVPLLQCFAERGSDDVPQYDLGRCLYTLAVRLENGGVLIPPKPSDKGETSKAVDKQSVERNAQQRPQRPQRRGGPPGRSRPIPGGVAGRGRPVDVAGAEADEKRRDGTPDPGDVPKIPEVNSEDLAARALFWMQSAAARGNFRAEAWLAQYYLTQTSPSADDLLNAAHFYTRYENNRVRQNYGAMVFEKGFDLEIEQQIDAPTWDAAAKLSADRLEVSDPPPPATWIEQCPLVKREAKKPKKKKRGARLNN
ncbi:MAG: hypothetical protein AAGF15_06915 [Pseudomonadota bacterium]